MVYFALLYFIPAYLQICHGMDPLQASVHILPWLITHGFWMTASGYVMSFPWPWRWPANKGQVSYGPMMWLGYTCLTAVCIGYSIARSVPSVDGLQVLAGFGTGSVFSNSILVLQSHTEQDETATVLGVRSLVRTIGGALGSAIGNVIIGQVLQRYLPARWKELSTKSFSKPPFSRMTAEDAEQTINAFEKGFEWAFICCTIIMGLCLALCWFIRDRGMHRQQIVQKERRLSAEHT